MRRKPGYLERLPDTTRLSLCLEMERRHVGPQEVQIGVSGKSIDSSARP
jgi:hypothetical protein